MTFGSFCRNRAIPHVPASTAANEHFYQNPKTNHWDYRRIFVGLWRGCCTRRKPVFAMDERAIHFAGFFSNRRVVAKPGQRLSL
jgi:hypothetical protein